MAFNRRLTCAVVVPVLMLLLVPVSSVYAVSLADLVNNGAVLYSQDGSVAFDNFAYIPTIGAPSASDILVDPDPSNPQGFKVSGVNGESFLAEDGESFSVFIGCEASLMDQASGEYLEASLGGLVSETTNPTTPQYVGSTATVNVKVDSLDYTLTPALLAVMDSVIGTDVLSHTESLTGFGNDAKVLMGISVYSSETGAKAEVSEFAVNLSNVPEPATGLALLCLAGLVARRRR